jgi:hypothetical protein
MEHFFKLALANSVLDIAKAACLINQNLGGVTIMNKSSFSQWVGASIFAFALALFAAQSAVASPTTEITRAVNVAGGADVKHAVSSTFMRGFNAVIIKVKQAETPLYVSAAVKMRPDLAPPITVATLNARDRHSCEDLSAIIKAAIAAAPDSRYAITRAVLPAQPISRQCVLQAARISEKDLRVAYTRQSDAKEVLTGREAIPPPTRAFPYPTIWDVGNIISINPGPGGFVTSPNGRGR